MLDDRGEVVGSSICEAETDGVALAVARRNWLGAARAVEVWKGPRLVGTLAASPDPETP